MTLSDDLDVFFSDSSAVSATAGSTTGKGHLDEPTNVAVGDQRFWIIEKWGCNHY